MGLVVGYLPSMRLCKGDICSFVIQFHDIMLDHTIIAFQHINNGYFHYSIPNVGERERENRISPLKDLLGYLHLCNLQDVFHPRGGMQSRQAHSIAYEAFSGFLFTRWSMNNSPDFI